MKMLRAASAGLLVLISMSAFEAPGQTRRLNPTVTVLPRPASAVPPECEQGLAPEPSPRIEVADLPQTPGPAVAPPSSGLRAMLADAQDAAERGDREGFRDALAGVKATLASYPAGGERQAATAAVNVYSDLDRIWTYEFDDPAGAFFDASSGLLDVMRSYPGYAAAMEGQTLVISGATVYPTAETRAFLVREAARRLAPLGINLPPRGAIRQPSREATGTRVMRPETAAPPTARSRKTAAESRRSAPAERSTRRSSHAPAGESQIAEATPHSHRSGRRTTSGSTTRTEHHAAPTAAPEHKAAAAPPHAQPKPPVAKTSAPPVATATHAAPATKPSAVASQTTPPAASASTSGSMTTAPPTTTSKASTGNAKASDTAASTSTAATTSTAPTTSTPSRTATSATETATSASPSTTTTTSSAPGTETSASAAQTGTAAAPPAGRGRNVILPIVLIVVGLGVLIVLFRASS